MAMKGYSTLLRSPKLEPFLSDTVKGHIQDASILEGVLWGIYSVYFKSHRQGFIIFGLIVIIVTNIMSVSLNNVSLFLFKIPFDGCTFVPSVVSYNYLYALLDTHTERRIHVVSHIVLWREPRISRDSLTTWQVNIWSFKFFFVLLFSFVFIISSFTYLFT